MRDRLIEILVILEEKKPTQIEKDGLYQDICNLRKKHKLSHKEFDDIGFNLLHWAVLSNQEAETIIVKLINGGIDINCGTKSVYGIGLSGVTPLRFTIQQNNENLARLLLKLGADKKEKSRDFYNLQGPLGFDHSYTLNTENAKYALSKANTTFKLFEKDFVTSFAAKREANKKEYTSDWPVFTIRLFGGKSRSEKIAAAQAYQNLLAEEQQDTTWNQRLKNLKNEHPAVNQGELGEIYQASLKARGM